jgi:hypothetical protein
LRWPEIGTQLPNAKGPLHLSCSCASLILFAVLVTHDPFQTLGLTWSRSETARPGVAS